MFAEMNNRIAANPNRVPDEISRLTDWAAIEGANPNKDWLTYESVYNHLKVSDEPARLDDS